MSNTVAPKAEMIQVDASTISVQPRTSMYVSLPAFFYFEPLPVKRAADAELEDDIEYDHQVDPHRTSSHSPIMPCLQRYRDTGNPYPADVNDEAIKTSDRWRPFAAISYAVFKLLSESSEPVTAMELIDEAVNMSGVGKRKDGSPSADAVACVNDTLRDLRLYGMAESDAPTRTAKKTKYRLAPGIDSLTLAIEAKSALSAA